MDKFNDLIDKKQIIHNKFFLSTALSEYVVLNCYDSLSREDLNFLAKQVSWHNISDPELSNKVELIKKLNWVEFVDRMAILRIATRDFRNIDLYPLSDYEYEADEIIKSAKIEPSLLDRLRIKQDSLKPRHIIEISKVHPSLMDRIDFKNQEFTVSESVEIARMGNKNIFEVFDFSNISDIEKVKILKAHNFSYLSLEKMCVFENDFDNKNHIREILLSTGNQYIDKLNVSNLFPSDWIILLKENLEFEPFIPLDDFFACDIFYFIELCILLPKHLEYLDETMAKGITSFGWEKLLLNIRNSDKLIELCNFDTLEERAWNTFQDRRPDLLLYRV